MTRLLIILVLCLSNSQGKDWLAEKSEILNKSSSYVVSNKLINKNNRISVGLSLGSSFRNDLASNSFLSAAGVYYLDSRSGVGASIDLARDSKDSLRQKIADQTGFKSNIYPAKYIVGAHYLYSPIYGKYSWRGNSIIRFDIYGTLGLGFRKTEVDNQPLITSGIGMNHFVYKNRLAITPEFKVLIYKNESTVIANQLKIGSSWLF
jgi:outer membrane beta-barrel protein